MRSKVNDMELEMSLECGGKFITNMVGVLLPRNGDRQDVATEGHKEVQAR